MRIYLHSLKTTLRGLALPLLGVLFLCFLCLRGMPSQVGTGDDRFAGYWLHLPGLLLVATALAATVESWPLFSRARPGFGWLLRVRGHALHGCVAAALGGLTALTAGLVLTGLAFSLMLSAMGFELGEVHRPAHFTAVEKRSHLHRQQPSLSFSCVESANLISVALQPRVMYSKELVLPRFRVLADGQPLGDGWFTSSGQRLTIPLDPPRPVQQITIERKDGPGMVLQLTADAVVAETSDVRPGYLNCILASLSFLAPALLALAAMVLGHSHLTLAVNLGLGLFVCLFTSLLDVTPSHAAVTAFARSRWIETMDVGVPMAQAAAAAGLLLALRLFLGKMSGS